MKLKYWFIILTVLVCAALSVPFLPIDGRVRTYCIEAAVLLVVVFLVVFYHKVITPYRIISEGMDLLKAQDYASHLKKVGQADADKIVDLFNALATQLRTERLSVRERNMLTDLLIREMPMGMIVLDFDNRVESVNPAAETIFRTADTPLAGLPQIEKGTKLSDFDTPLCAALSSLKDEESKVFRFGNAMICRCSRLSFFDHGFKHPFLLVEGLTDEIVEAERKSYGGVIRMISHEVGNTVAAVKATLDVLSSDLSSDLIPAIDACTKRCEEMTSFVSRYAEVVKLPSPTLALVDICDFVKGQSVILDNLCTSKGLRLVLPQEDTGFRAMIDSVMLSQVIVNVVKNSTESTGASEVRISIDKDSRLFEVSDNGEGISSEVADKLFSPFFTTKDNGQGIGLMMTSEILRKHSVRYSLETGEDGITRFRMFFPTLQ